MATGTRSVGVSWFVRAAAPAAWSLWAASTQAAEPPPMPPPLVPPAWRLLDLGITARAVDGRVGPIQAGERGAGVVVDQAGLGFLGPHLVLSATERLDLEFGSGWGGFTILGSGVFDFGLDAFAPLGKGHGPFAGVGVRAEYDLNPDWLFGEVPRAEAGYLWLRSGLALRAYGFASFFASTGSIDTHTKGTLTRPEYGARLFAASSQFWTSGYFIADFHHVLGAGGDPGAPVDEITGQACLVFVSPFAACADARLFRGASPTYPLREVEWRMWSIEVVLEASHSSAQSPPAH